MPCGRTSHLSSDPSTGGDWRTSSRRDTALLVRLPKAMRKSMSNSAPIVVTDDTLRDLTGAAWAVRERSYVLGKTRVGAALLCDDGRIFTGCNVEHRFRCNDVHAEVNAITTMVAGGGRSMSAIVVVAERDRFTPCGGCLDWIFQFGGEKCVVAYQARPDGTVIRHTAADLMPHYPQ
jgi:cytidine deaminase